MRGPCCHRCRATDLAGDAPAAQAQWHRRALVDGTWVPELTVYLDNRPMSGRVGFFVVTPLQLDDGRTAVLVQRGWLPRAADERTRIAPYRTEPGRVRLEGRIAPSPSRLYDLGSAASGPIRQNLDVAAYAAETRRRLLPLVIVQDDPGTAPWRWPGPAVAATGLRPAQALRLRLSMVRAQRPGRHLVCLVPTHPPPTQRPTPTGRLTPCG